MLGSEVLPGFAPFQRVAGTQQAKLVFRGTGQMSAKTTSAAWLTCKDVLAGRSERLYKLTSYKACCTVV